MRQVFFVRGALVLGTLCATLVVSQPQAHAERVISDLEATKLTFASLTAAPRPRPVVRHVAASSHTARQHVVLASAHTTRSSNMVHFVSYHAPSHPLHAKKSVHHHRT
ncbi:hypothetical protein K2X14_03320 [Acetobacter sp. TBRC 12305]|uniref:Uncharacterized protein n=1 Tax=Acetobacter garciniae TaxID=2817435 RepID=A0A939HMP7_9PROT|nr:hypothetical protein [Acetobacter garciniae]MBO1324187.1 hypothetical protein [Acetobacter garciniae]MBX0343876.1 hypothetical protein [Acetobacter garciniae]